MSGFKRILLSNIKNIGKRITIRKLVIFESDDWGSNRIASPGEFKKLVEKGILAGKISHYDKNDTIARAKDLELLFETLNSVKDKNNHPAVFSPFVNPSNPDFERIRQNGFQQYFPENFSATLENSGERREVISLWKQGINAGIFIPAFHGREHLCVPLWMKYLQEKDGIVRKAFDCRFYSVPLNTLPTEARAFRPALYFTDPTQIPLLKDSITEGIGQMKELFGISPKVFCPPNGISHPVFDEISSQAGIRSIITNRFRSEPDGEGGCRPRHYGYASKNEWGQRYYYRNCCFEPTYSHNSVDTCLMQLEAAFRWYKPAIITSHRVNYIGTINPENREKGLKQLKILLTNIVNKWPDVEFISSDDFSDILHNYS